MSFNDLLKLAIYLQPWKRLTLNQVLGLGVLEHMDVHFVYKGWYHWKYTKMGNQGTPRGAHSVDGELWENQSWVQLEIYKSALRSFQDGSNQWKELFFESKETSQCTTPTSVLVYDPCLCAPYLATSNLHFWNEWSTLQILIKTWKYLLNKLNL